MEFETSPSEAAPTDRATASTISSSSDGVETPRKRKHAARQREETVALSLDVIGELTPKLEAILMSLDRPVPGLRIAQGLGLIPGAEDASDALPEVPEGPVAKVAVKHVEQVVASLNAQYESSNRAFRVELLAGGYRVMTLPAFAGVLATFHKRQSSAKLSRAAVETLAIIAYKQPLTRAELEAIRGVGCGEVLKTLLEKRLVTIKGRAEELGRPLLYGTTTEFLKHFGLSSIKDLPSPTELKL